VFALCSAYQKILRGLVVSTDDLFLRTMAKDQVPRRGTGSGQSIAGSSAVRGKTVHPIDTLLVQQLENLLDGERQLKARYSALDPSLDTPEVRMAFSQELAELKARTDRLYRFVSALDYYGSLDSSTLAAESMSMV
jgi:hypothetical protein